MVHKRKLKLWDVLVVDRDTGEDVDYWIVKAGSEAEAEQKVIRLGKIKDFDVIAKQVGKHDWVIDLPVHRGIV